MTSEGVLRRSSYGPTSPVVGERGARTRERIYAEALALFAAQGFHLTSVNEIARAAGVSRATLYQYFPDKEQIFIDLLDECGRALLRVMRRLGPLGPTVDGFANLRWWITEWAAVYDEYVTLFVQWANIGSPLVVTSFVGSYNSRVAERLRGSGLVGLDADAAAMVLTGVIHRFNYLRHHSASRAAPTERLLFELAVTLQLVLFPATPTAAIAPIPDGPISWPRRTSAGTPGQSARPIPAPAAEAASGSLPAAETASLSARRALTVQRLLDAGAAIFAERGYHRSNIDDTVRLAGYARGTFYKYFDEKFDLLLALSEHCACDAVALGDSFGEIRPGPDQPAALRAWIEEYLTFHGRYIGVVRTWLESSPNHPELARHRTRAMRAMANGISMALSQFPRPYPVDLRACGMFLVALLERVPDGAAELEQSSRAATVELIATVFERGVLVVSADG